MPAPIRIRFFTRQNCGLCKEAEAILDRLAQRARLTVEKIDIDTDPHLQNLWGYSVPVVEVDGEVRFRLRVYEHELASVLGLKD